MSLPLTIGLAQATTNPGYFADDIKVDESGWQIPPPSESGWVRVERGRTSPHQTPRKTTRRERPSAPIGTQKIEAEPIEAHAAAEREKIRVAAFRASVDRRVDPPNSVPGFSSTRTCRPPPISVAPTRHTIRVLEPVSAPDLGVAPSVSRSKFDVDRIKAKRRAGLKRKFTPSSHPPLPQVTKKQASEPVGSDGPFGEVVARNNASEFVNVRNSFEPLVELSRGPQVVIQTKKTGTSMLHNHSGRTKVTTFRAYSISNVKFVGWCKLLNSSFTPDAVGFWYSTDKKIVRLPTTLIAELGTFLVDHEPNWDTYKATQGQVRNRLRDVDMSADELEDAMIYAPYLAFTTRADERRAVTQLVRGNVFGRAAQSCLKFGTMASAAMAIPVAAAARSATGSAALASALSFAALTAGTVATALAVKASLAYFRPDDKAPRHAKLASVTSAATPPEQHPLARVVRLDIEKRDAGACRDDAARVTGIAFKNKEPTVFAKNQDNTIAALQKRSAVLPPKFNLADREAYTKFVIKNWPILVGDFHKLNVPEDVDSWVSYAREWVEGCNSSRVVKDIYLRTIRELAEDGITPHSELTPSQLHEWTKRDACVKNETVLKGQNKSPRQILAAAPQFVVLTAPFIKQLTGVVRGKWKLNFQRVYAPGCSAKKLAEAMTEHEWDNCANLDFDGYDSAQDVTIADMEITICKMYHAPRAHLQLMRANKSTHGSSRQGVKFETPYVRNSGDPWTTLFNTVLNATLMTYAYCKQRECDVREVRAKFFAGGDDGSIWYDGDRIDFFGVLGELGFPITIKHVEDLHHVEFLSCRLTHTSTGWNLIPMVGKTIAKLGYSVRATSDHKAKQIARGAAMSMYAASSGCPPLRAYLDAIMRVTQGVEAEEARFEPWKMTNGETGQPTTDTWSQLYDVYNWTPQSQVCFQEALDAVKTCGEIIDTACGEMLIDRDHGREDISIENPPDSDPIVLAAVDSVGDSEARAAAHNREMHASNGNIRPIVLQAGPNPRRRRVRALRQPRIVVRAQRRIRPRPRNALVVATRRLAPRARGGLVSQLSATPQSRYMCCLNDPFNCPPVRLGAGCMVPTGLTTMYVTLPISTTTPSLSLVIYPRPWNNVLTSVTQVPNFAYSSASVFTQLAQLQATANGARCVAMGIKLTSTSSATNDAGLVNGGLIPRDNFSPTSVTNGSPPTITFQTSTDNGLPFIAGTASQGFSNFLNYEQTESFAARKGISMFYRPEDPLDFVFRNFGYLNAFSNSTTATTDDLQMSSPCFVIGLTGLPSTATFLLEISAHFEYTTGPFSGGLITTDVGKMTTDQVIQSSRSVFGSRLNTVKEGISTGFHVAEAISRIAGGPLGRTIGNIANRAANYFSSSDNQAALVPTRRNFMDSIMDVD